MFLIVYDFSEEKNHCLIIIIIIILIFPLNIFIGFILFFFSQKSTNSVHII